MSRKKNFRKEIPQIKLVAEVKKSPGTKDTHLKFWLNQKGAGVTDTRLFGLEGKIYNLEQGLINLWNLRPGSKLKVTVEVKNRNNREKRQ